MLDVQIPEIAAISPKPSPDFNLNASNEVVQKYKPQFIAKGGEHLVYVIANHPDVVVKAKIDSIKANINFNVEYDLSPDTLDPRFKSDIENDLHHQELRFHQMQNAFGLEHVLNQRSFLAKVPVTPNILKSIGAKTSTSEVWSILTVQKKARELENPYLTPAAGYAEKNPPDETTYDQVTDKYFFHPENGTGEFNKAEFLSTQSSTDLSRLIDAADADPALKSQLADFVAKAIKYTQDTGEILDLAGSGNVTFYRDPEKNNAWNYRIIDGLYPGDDDALSNAQGALTKTSLGVSTTKREMNAIMNVVNYSRTINGLAHYLDQEQRLYLSPESTKSNPPKLLPLIRTSQKYT